MINSLYKHQKTGIKFVLAQKKVIFCWDMGTGKTLGALHAYKETGKQRLLIICPANIKYQWRDEAQRVGVIAEVLKGRKNKQLNQEVECYIINYDIISHWVAAILAYAPDMIIIDECQYIQNVETTRSHAVRDLAKLSNAEYVLGLSGTPITTHAGQYWAILSVVKKDVPSYFHWLNLFCTRNIYGKFVRSHKNYDRLIAEIKPYVDRVRKEEVLDLPEKLHMIIPVDHTLQLTREEGATPELLTNIKHKLFEFKKKAIFEWIDTFLETDKKLVIFGFFISHLEEVYERYKDQSVYIDGSVNPEKRQQLITSFRQDTSVRLCIAQISTIGIGVDGLQHASDTCLYLDIYTPAAHMQSEDRLYRAGQKNSVSCYYPIIINSFDEFLYKRLLQGCNYLKKVFNGTQGEERWNFKQLVNEYFDQQGQK